MRYIRTKDGRIAEVKENMIVKDCDDATRLVYKKEPYICVLNGNDDILKQADTLEDLIMPEDLVEVDYNYYYRIEHDRGDYLLAYSKDIIKRERITAWFINVAKNSEMEGRFIQIAERNEKGELELL